MIGFVRLPLASGSTQFALNVACRNAPRTSSASLIGYWPSRASVLVLSTSINIFLQALMAPQPTLHGSGKCPKTSAMAWSARFFVYVRYVFYIRISASQPAGRLRFCRESMVFGVGLVISIRRLCTRIS